jgi:hypothetical protein
VIRPILIDDRKLYEYVDEECRKHILKIGNHADLDGFIILMNLEESRVHPHASPQQLSEFFS